MTSIYIHIALSIVSQNKLRLCMETSIKSLISISNNDCDTYSVYPNVYHRNQREKDRLAEAITENIEREVIIVFTEPAHGNWYASDILL